VSIGDHPDQIVLSETDQRVLDALIEADFDLERVSVADRPRAKRIGQLLGLLGSPIEPASADLTSRTLSRVLGLDRLPTQESVLCQDDADALEALILAGGEVGRLPSRLRERASRHAAMAQLVAQTPLSQTPDRADLIASTLARIDAAIEAEDGRMIMSRRPAMRWADLVSAAAVILLMISVAFPVLGAIRDQARRGSCSSNLGRVAQAVGIYAGAHHASLPTATAGFGGGSWMNVGTTPEQSNSANLFVLVRGRYAQLADLACAGNPNAPTNMISAQARDWSRLEEISYSYQVQDGRRDRVWASSTPLVIVADRSPVVLRIARREAIIPEENSPNHGQRGQHAMTTDGAVQWLTNPVLAGGDNIWLSRPIEQAVALIRQYHGMTGSEVPASVDDALLGP
jgi:hypothetical protein